MKKPPQKGERRAAKPVRSASRSIRRSPRFSREVRIVYEDDVVVVLDKPPGVLAVPVKESDMPSAWAVLSAELHTRKQKAFVVHRIDRFTSGLLLFAKTPAARDMLVRQFIAHTPVREYLAVVRGRLAEPEGKLVHYLKREGMHQKLRPESDREAAQAELLYKVERPLMNASLVRVKLVTGLQNQIRVQFAAIGHPVIGDRKYQPEEADERRIARVALHAAHLEFKHPQSGQMLAVDSDLPGDIRSLVQQLTPPARRPGK